MIVYRIENADGNGPFTSAAYPGIIDLCERMEVYPRPWGMPSPLDDEHKHHGEMIKLYDGIFAFSSMEMLDQYFCKPVRQYMQCDFEIHIIDVDETFHHAHDEIQCSFIKKHSTTIDILDIFTMESKLK